MDVENFVKNLKAILDERGISYARAGRESGAGIDFIRMMELRGSVPSYIKVQMMAQYLGMTTSELLGETKSVPATDSGEKTAPSPEDWRKALSALSTEELLQVQELISREFGNRLK